MSQHPRTTAALLAAERADACARVERLRSDFDAIVASARDTATDDEHDPEGQTIAFERSQLSALLSSAERQVAQLDSAAERLADGSYGTCAQCGRPVGAERLDARPTATTCITCAMEHQHRR